MQIHTYTSFVDSKQVCLLIALTSRTIVAIDYVKREEIWVASLDYDININLQGSYMWKGICKYGWEKLNPKKTS